MRVSFRLKSTEDSLKQLILAVNGKLDLYDNFFCKVVDVPDSGPANTEFTVTHSLGRIPIFYLANIDQAGIVYDSNRATWTDTQLTLKCSVANAVIKLLVQ